jgi:hypothetical protein
MITKNVPSLAVSFAGEIRLWFMLQCASNVNHKLIFQWAKGKVYSAPNLIVPIF